MPPEEKKARAQSPKSGPFPVEALIRFKAQPDGPSAIEDLRTLSAAIEQIPEPTERKRSAVLLAREFLGVIKEALPREKPGITSAVGFCLSESAALTEAMLSESRVSGEASARTRVRPESGRRGARLQFILDGGRLGDLEGIGLDALLERIASARLSVMRDPVSASQRLITPDDLVVLGAVRDAVKKKGSLAIDQVLDIFDYVSRSVEYLNSPDGAVPRAPAVTLQAKVGDCKCMAVTLASMLEAIGAKTVLVVHAPPEKSVGHEYVGVLIFNGRDRREHEDAMRLVSEIILSRYKIFIDLTTFGQRPRLHFREMTTSDGRIETYLILDATTGRVGIPGTLNFEVVPGSEHVSESRPFTSSGAVMRLE